MKIRRRVLWPLMILSAASLAGGAFFQLQKWPILEYEILEDEIPVSEEQSDYFYTLNNLRFPATCYERVYILARPYQQIRSSVELDCIGFLISRPDEATSSGCEQAAQSIDLTLEEMDQKYTWVTRRITGRRILFTGSF